jgi:hypothetical protein
MVLFLVVVYPDLSGVEATSAGGGTNSAGGGTNL